MALMKMKMLKVRILFIREMALRKTMTLVVGVLLVRKIAFMAIKML